MITTPDIVLLGGEWPKRALLRAQLIEEGYDVVAIDAWPIPPPERVLVVTALGTLTADKVRRVGLTAIERPTTIGRIVETAARILAAPEDTTNTTSPRVVE